MTVGVVAHLQPPGVGSGRSLGAPDQRALAAGAADGIIDLLLALDGLRVRGHDGAPSTAPPLMVATVPNELALFLGWALKDPDTASRGRLGAGVWVNQRFEVVGGLELEVG